MGAGVPSWGVVIWGRGSLTSLGFGGIGESRGDHLCLKVQLVGGALFWIPVGNRGCVKIFFEAHYPKQKITLVIN